MKIEIVAKNYSVNENLNEIFKKKLAKLDKFFEDDAKCKVYLKVENRISKLEIAVEHHHITVRAEARAENFYDAIDILIPKLERQISKHRSKLEARLKKGAFVGVSDFSELNETFKLVKTKQFELSPMSVEDAIDEFELMGFSFYVFCDISDKKIKVLYLRDDGNIGLIDPIVAKAKAK